MLLLFFYSRNVAITDVQIGYWMCLVDCNVIRTSWDTEEEKLSWKKKKQAQKCLSAWHLFFGCTFPHPVSLFSTFFVNLLSPDWPSLNLLIILFISIYLIIAKLYFLFIKLVVIYFLAIYNNSWKLRIILMSGEVYWKFARLRSGIIIFFLKFHDKFVTSRYHCETIRRRF